MATTTSYTTGISNANREDLTDVIYDISPMETPCMSMFARAKATNTLHQWQTDSLATASSSNFSVEGADSSDTTLSGTTRATNYTAISTKDGKISETQIAINTAGKDDEYRYQVAKTGRELKRDMESIICANNAKAAGGAATARECAGIESWIASNTSKAGSDPTGDGSDARTDGTQRAFTEDQLKTVLQSCWDSGGDPDCLVVGGFNKQVVSGFSGNATRYSTADDKKLITSVEVYVSDFGTLKVIPNRFSRSRSALVLQKDMWAVAYLRPFKVKKLAKVGDSERFSITVEYTLEARNQAANGIVADLTTS